SSRSNRRAPTITSKPASASCAAAAAPMPELAPVTTAVPLVMGQQRNPRAVLDRVVLSWRMRARAAVGLVAVAVLLVVVTACQTWTSVNHDPAFTNFNSEDTALSSSNVAQVAERFEITGPTTLPVFALGEGFVGHGSQLVAFDKAGNGSCGGSPRTCAP